MSTPKSGRRKRQGTPELALSPSLPRVPSIPRELGGKKKSPTKKSSTPKAAKKARKSTDDPETSTASSSFSLDSEAEDFRQDVFGRPSVAASDAESTERGFDTARESNNSIATLSTPKKRRAASSTDDGKAQNIVVCVRIRPGKPAEEDIWTLDATESRIRLSENHPLIKSRGKQGKDDAYDFRFDSIILPTQTTTDLYDQQIGRIVTAAIEGFNSTIFAYGQTGSGKTHTMMGSPGEPGIIHQAVSQIFSAIEADDDRQYLLRVSYLEIYNESLKDLLSPSSSSSGRSSPLPIELKIRESRGKIYVDPLKEEVVTRVEEVFDALDRGEHSRHVGTTDWNARSSRSHCVFTMTIESTLKEGSGSTRISQLNLIDLAGSEKMSSGQGSEVAERNTEGSHINKSLLALGNVIGKLSSSAGKTSSQHIPYRDSKLTRLLQTSLGGNARVAVVCTVSPDPMQAAESVSTLKFARSAKMVITKAERGLVMDEKSALIQKYQREVEQLRSQLKKQNEVIQNAEDDEELLEAKEEQRKHLGVLEDERTKAEMEIAEMRQKRTQLADELQNLTRLLLTGSSSTHLSHAADRSSDALRRQAGPPGTLRRNGYNRRISEIGLGLGTPQKAGLPETPSKRAFSNQLDTIASPRTGTVERETMLEKALEANERNMRTKDDQIFKLEADLRSFTARLEFQQQEQASLQTAHQEELQSLKAASTTLQSELESARKLATEKATELEGSQQSQLQLTSELHTSRSQLEEAQKALFDARSGSQNNEDAAKANLALLAARDEAIADLRRQLEAVTAEKSKTDGQNAAKTKELEEFKSSMKTSAETKDAITTALQSRLVKAEKIIKSTQSDLAKSQAKSQATAKLLVDLQKRRDEAEAEIAGSKGDQQATTEELQIARANLSEFRESHREALEEWQEEERRLKAELTSALDQIDADAARQEEIQKAVSAAQLEISSLKAALDRKSAEAQQNEAEVNRLRELRKPALPSTPYGPTAVDLTAKLQAAQAKSGLSSSLSRKSTDVAADPKISGLHDTIAEKNWKIAGLEKLLAEATPAKSGSSLLNRPSSSMGLTSVPARSSTLRESRRYDDELDEAASRSGRAEMDRLNQVIEAQKTTISDLQLDLKQWRLRMAAQRDLIHRMQREGVVDASQLLSLPNSPQISPTKTSFREQPYSPPSAYSLQDNLRSAQVEGIAPTRTAKSSDSSSSGSPVKREYGLSSPVMDRFTVNPESPSKKYRRQTIEHDIERLALNKPVERQRSVLLTPRAAQAKQKRILSGLDKRASILKQQPALPERDLMEYQENTSSAKSWYV